MNYIEHLDIRGFWGAKDVHIEFHRDLNFLIGPNGSGKTTIINILAAALRADIPTLYTQPFDQILIGLKSTVGNRKPLIQVSKTADKRFDHFTLEFTVKSRRSEKGTQYIVNAPFDDRLYPHPRYPQSHRLIEERTRLVSILSDLIEVNWLSIHRTTTDSDRRRPRDNMIESSVDVKLLQLSDDFSKYFSLLSSRADAESASFQEHVFLSLLAQNHDVERIFREIGQLSPDRPTIISALEDLGVDQKRATQSVSQHLSRLAAANDRWQQAPNSVLLEDAITVSDALRVVEMIAKWRELQDRRAGIFLPRRQFEQIINNLFSDKQLTFDARNVPKVRLASGEELDIHALSSGEKQLFMLLGETLLQENRPVVFISDEPELSLHVSWQNSLFENVGQLNHECQIISATHSPDIVGSFQDRVIQVTECMSHV